MAGIVTALEPDHGIGAAREPVDDLALALVAPLRPDDGTICHDAVLLSGALPARRGCSGFGRRGKGSGTVAMLFLAVWRGEKKDNRSEARSVGKEWVSGV